MSTRCGQHGHVLFKKSDCPCDNAGTGAFLASLGADVRPYRVQGLGAVHASVPSNRPEPPRPGRSASDRLGDVFHE